MAQKKLQPDSQYQALDLDGDGVVSDAELAVVEDGCPKTYGLVCVGYYGFNDWASVLCSE